MKETLKKFGLSEKEAELYLILLELGKAKVQDITRKTKLPRSTIYSVLEYLEQRGLVFSFDQGKIRFFSPQDPDRIIQEAAARAEALKTLLPNLQQLYRNASARPHIRYYEGVEELKQMYTGILRIPGLKAYDIIASEEEWLNIDPTFFETFKQQRAQAGIRTRLILEHSPAALARKAQAEATNSEVKIVPQSFPWKLSAGCYIFEDRVIFIAYQKEHVACEIHSAEIASLQHLVFEFLWNALV